VISRREAIRIALGGAGGFAFAGWSSAVLTQHLLAKGSFSPFPAAEKPPSSNIGGLQIGCMTWSFRDRPLAMALRSIAQIGFSSAELWNGHLDPFKASDRELSAWKGRFEDSGVKLTSYFVEIPKGASDRQISRCFQAGTRLGVPILSGNFSKALIPRIDRACQEHKMYVGLHNEVYNPPDPGEVGSAKDYIEVFQRSSHWVGATLDVGHLYAAGDDPVTFIREHFTRIVSIHLKDESGGARTTDYPFGKGPTPLTPILRTLQSLRFKRCANIEWGVENVDPTQGVADALAYVRRALA
jgi:sugar phosphate isomerase/epimerase